MMPVALELYDNLPIQFKSQRNLNTIKVVYQISKDKIPSCFVAWCNLESISNIIAFIYYRGNVKYKKMLILSRRST
jgi:hypothetical protein